jgi:hypothetical protein
VEFIILTEGSRLGPSWIGGSSGCARPGRGARMGGRNMAGTGEDTEYYRWTFPGAPICIHIRFDVLDGILADVFESAKQSGQMKAAGLLLGTCQGVNVYVTERVRCNSRAVFPSGMTAPPREKVLGFYRFVPPSEWNLTDRELEVIESHFKGPASVFLHLRSNEDGQLTGGFFFRDGGTVLEECFMEFPCDTTRLRNERQSVADSSSRRVESTLCATDTPVVPDTPVVEPPETTTVKAI